MFKAGISHIIMWIDVHGWNTSYDWLCLKMSIRNCIRNTIKPLSDSYLKL